jgi:hypothetical protein
VAWRLIGKRFGKEIVQLKQEIDTHAKSAFEHIGQGSDPAKLFLMASDIIQMQAFVDAVQGRGTLQDENGFDLNVKPVTSLPEIASLEKFFMKVSGTTSCAALEERYEATLKELREAYHKHHGKPHHSGRGTLRLPPSKNDGNGRVDGTAPGVYPAFEMTWIAFSAQAKAAYEIIAGDGRTIPDNFLFAIRAAEVLSKSSEDPNADAVVIALLSNAVPDITAKDLALWESWGIGRGVTSILGKKNPGRIYDSEQFLLAPDAFRQAAFASAIATMEMLRESAASMLEIRKSMDDTWKRLNGRADDSSRVVKEASAHLQSGVEILKTTLEDIRRIYVPMFGTTSSPQLEEMLRETLDLLAGDIARLLPKPAQSKNPPPPGRRF